VQFHIVPAILIGGGLFVAVILVAGYLTPGYSHARQSISELAAPGTPAHWLVRWMGFVPLGLSFLFFAIQSGRWFSTSIPSALFLLIGLSIMLAGIFSTDPENRRDSASGKIHAGAVIVLLLLLSAAPFTFSIASLYKIPPPEWFLAFSFVMGILVSILVAPSSNDVLARGLMLFQRTSNPVLGLLQRLVLILHAIWWLVFSQILAGESHLR
jgi:hypothetical protein